MTKRERDRLRQQRRRDRMRAGKRVISIEVDEALVEDALVAGGFLADTDDHKKVAAALASAIHAWSEEQIAAALVR